MDNIETSILDDIEAGSNALNTVGVTKPGNFPMMAEKKDRMTTLTSCLHIKSLITGSCYPSEAFTTIYMLLVI